MPPRTRMALPPVPTTAQVVPGAQVHIVLKQDQPTGRTVHGVVQNVLTRGNHPRGIKVRLSDGRVGRVQMMGDARAVPPPPASTPLSLANAWPAAEASGKTDRVDEAPTEQLGLDAFIKPARRQPQKHKKGGSASMTETSAGRPNGYGDTGSAGSLRLSTTTTTCPVCGDFEGDEAAVSHHVASHFET